MRLDDGREASFASFGSEFKRPTDLVADICVSAPAPTALSLRLCRANNDWVDVHQIAAAASGDQI